MASKGNETPGGFNDFTLVSGFRNGYRAREDRTVLPPGILVAGSENVLTNTHQRIGIRKGYTLDGQANTDLAPIAGGTGAMGVFDWKTTGGNERHMRAGFLTDAGNDGKLQYRYVAEDGTVTWRDLLTNLTSVAFNYTIWWDTYQFLQVMLAVNGGSDIIYWGGGVTTLASAANTTGIVGTIRQHPETVTLTDSGGVGYVVGDQLTIAAGNNNAVLTVYEVQSGAIDSSAIKTAGTGYAVNDTITVNGGGTAPYAHLKVTSIGGGGAVTGYSVINNGHGYSVASGVTTITGGAGTGFTLDINSVGNGVKTWGFATAASRGSGYSVSTLVPTTGGSGTNAKVDIQTILTGSLTKSGTQTWAEAGFTFANSGTVDSHQVTINGTVYTYSSVNDGDSTMLVGITPDPSGETAGSIVHQTPVVYANQANPDPLIVDQTSLPADFKNDLIGVLQQRLFIGSLTDSKIYISEVNSFLEGSWNVVGTSSVGGALLVVTTSPPTAFIPQEEFMYITAGRDEWYNISFTVGVDYSNLTATESATINLLNTTAQQAAQSQAVTNKIANSVVFLSNEPYLNTFGRVQNILAQNAPQMTDISYSIVNDMNSYDFTGACVFYYRKFVYLAVPRENLVLIYNMTDPQNPYWEAPQRMPIARFSIIDGELYGHSSLVSETYKLFTGTNDNGYAITARAAFSFNNYGTRTQTKGYNEFYVEGYIARNTTLKLGVQFDIDGCATNTYYDIVGSDTQIVCIPTDSASLGKTSLGKNPLGGTILPSSENQNPKFRVIKTFPIHYFYEDQITFTSSGTDQQWEIIGFGPQLLEGGNLNNSITQ